ncbi:MAG: orotidine-5'-phosphate decarboxylase [Gammaproteobacteria bacterium]|nr:MAG: orotidine-5'-phosphate decarboxylase [Gammaproteobacteria bacterium]
MDGARGGEPRLVVALDYPDPREALALARGLDPSLCRLKVGLELYTRGGPEVVRALQALGFQLFLDLKFHDIPHTVAAACRAGAALGVWMLNVHALGGEAMLRAAREALAQASPGSGRRPLLVAVTVLTSLDAPALEAVGLPGPVEARVLHLARLARRCGLDGVVCSAREAALLRRELGPGFLLVTPGIRPAWAAADDQRRTLGPREALAAGADYLVVGRPVTRAGDPRAALGRLAAELAGPEGPSP